MKNSKTKDYLENHKELVDRYRIVRNYTEKLCCNLETEDYCVQPANFVSPPKWHLAHTTWFYEQMILSKYVGSYQVYNSGFSLLFNSYYKQVGEHWLQSDRGNLSRPTVKDVYNYRSYVDEFICSLKMDNLSESELTDLNNLLELGINHEEQHQELLLMDIKYILAMNPERPRYSDEALPRLRNQTSDWVDFKEGIYELGTSDTSFFKYDNESPRHKVFLQNFKMRNSFVTNAEFLEFLENDGYENPKYWLSMGWDWVCKNNIKSPLYWEKINGDWKEYTLHGSEFLDPHKPVLHISYFEADAFAKWKGLRLPTEGEIEVYLSEYGDSEQVVGLHPTNNESTSNQLWAWTSTQYSAYPGFKPLDGALGEYNGKFMCNQFVLRGGCIATPKGHYRNTYRNFYLPEQRWMFSGIRLAKDL